MLRKFFAFQLMDATTNWSFCLLLVDPVPNTVGVKPLVMGWITLKNLRQFECQIIFLEHFHKPVKKLLNISNKKIIDFEIPTGNPLLITFSENLEIKKYKYLDDKRAKNILFNV